MSPKAPAMNEELPGVWGMAYSTLREAPPQTRRVFMLMTGNWVLIVAMQLIFDSDGVKGTYETLELMSLMLGATGALLLMLVHVLNKSTGTSTGSATNEVMFTRMLAALPVFGAAAGMMVASTVVLYVARAMTVPVAGDVAILLTLAGIFLFVAGMAIKLIRESVLTLYTYASQQTTLAADATAQAAHATAQAATSELRALQAQMNPHFLFNALNTVASLVRTDPRAAERTVENLGDVLRMTLHRSETLESTVRAEIDFLRAYIGIEQERFGDRLRVRWDVADEALDQPLPPLMLQPLVENAIRHGFGARGSGGEVRIAAHVRNGALHLSVSDDGEGFGNGHPEGTGIGNLRRRLATLYGDAAKLSIDSSATGSRVDIVVPQMVAA